MENLNINTIIPARKYKMTDETIYVFGRTLHRIESLRDFSDVKIGDKGGWIEKEDNLSHGGLCWVYDEAMVYDEAKVYQNAKIVETSEIYGFAQVFGEATIAELAFVFDYAKICGNAKLSGWVRIYGSSTVLGNAEVYGNVDICDNVSISGNAKVCGNGVCVSGCISLLDNACICNTHHYMHFQMSGYLDGSVAVFKTTDSHMISSRYFSGTIDEFEEAVEEVHGDSQYGLEYKAIIEVIKLRIKTWEG